MLPNVLLLLNYAPKTSVPSPTLLIRCIQEIHYEKLAQLAISQCTWSPPPPPPPPPSPTHCTFNEWHDCHYWNNGFSHAISDETTCKGKYAWNEVTSQQWCICGNCMYRKGRQNHDSSHLTLAGVWTVPFIFFLWTWIDLMFGNGEWSAVIGQNVSNKYF